MRAQLAAARAAVELVGPDLAASYFLQQERAYWQRHNSAGALQHARQDRLGLGWGNNDHHTFRSSRAAFAPLIGFLTLLGFRPPASGSTPGRRPAGVPRCSNIPVAAG